jgi:hypothetical protein
MMTTMPQENNPEQAKRQVERKKEFFIHLTVYIVVNIILLLIWAFVTSGGFPWFIFPLGGWGIGVLCHYLVVFVFGNNRNESRQ